MQQDGLSLTPSAVPDALCQTPCLPSISATTLSPKTPSSVCIPSSFSLLNILLQQPKVMWLVARVLHSWEVMRNRNALNSRSGIHSWGYVCEQQFGGCGGWQAPDICDTKCLEAFEEFYIYRVQKSWGFWAVRVRGAEGYLRDSKIKCLQNIYPPSQYCMWQIMDLWGMIRINGSVKHLGRE